MYTLSLKPTCEQVAAAAASLFFTDQGGDSDSGGGGGGGGGAGAGAGASVAGQGGSLVTASFDEVSL